LKDATCEECQESTKLSKDKTKCEYPADCDNDDFYITKEGECKECSDYQRTMPANRSRCVIPKCEDNEIITKFGECEECP